MGGFYFIRNDAEISVQGILLGGGRDNDIFNNIFIGSSTAIHVDARGLGYCGPSSNSTLMDNLALVPYQSDIWRVAFPTLYNILDVRSYQFIFNLRTFF